MWAGEGSAGSSDPDDSSTACGRLPGRFDGGSTGLQRVLRSPALILTVFGQLPTELQRELDGGSRVLRTPKATEKLGKKLVGFVAEEGVGITLDVS